EREYDISAAYGIAHWWFSRKQFYINRHSDPSDRDAVRSHMRFLTVMEKDFKSLHPNDFEDLNILHIQGKLDHLPKQDTVNLHNAEVIYRDRDDNRKMMRINEFNKGTENRKWTADDKRRSGDFIEVIERRLKIRRIF
ncbi:hypothetical protein Tco_0041775, partial [Tanacetum coccineum]